MQKHRHKTALLAILQEYAPDGTAQQKCTEMVHEMQDAGESDDKITEALASSIVDGLRHGNWPWVTRT